MFCPNFSDPKVRQEFSELEAAVGEKAAYDIWNKNNGNAIDRAPNGAPSILFSHLQTRLGSRINAILAKAKTLGNSFIANFKGNQDENGEPLTSELGDTILSLDTRTRFDRVEAVSSLLLNRLKVSTKLFTPRISIQKIPFLGVKRYGVKKEARQRLDSSYRENLFYFFQKITGIEINPDRRLNPNVTAAIDEALTNAVSVWKKRLEDLGKTNSYMTYESAQLNYAIAREFRTRAITYGVDEAVKLYDPEQQETIKLLLPKLFVEYADKRGRILSEAQKIAGYAKFVENRLKKQADFEFANSKLNDLRKTAMVKRYQTLIDMSDIIPDWKKRIKDYVEGEAKRYNNPAIHNKIRSLNREFHSADAVDYVTDPTKRRIFGVLNGDRDLGVKQLDRFFPGESRLSESLFEKEFLNSTTAVSALRLIVDTSDDPEHVAIAETFLQYAISSDTPIYLTVGENDDAAGAHASRAKLSDGLAEVQSEIYIANDPDYSEHLEETLLHEISHSLTASVLKLDTELRDSIQEYIDFIKSEWDIFTDYEIPYGLNNPREFVAELYSNPYFVNALKLTRPMNSNKFSSLFQEIIQRIVDSLNKIFKAVPKNAYDQIIQITDEIFAIQAEKDYREDIRLKQIKADLENENVKTETQTSNQQLAQTSTAQDVLANLKNKKLSKFNNRVIGHLRKLSDKLRINLNNVQIFYDDVFSNVDYPDAIAYYNPNDNTIHVNKSHPDFNNQTELIKAFLHEITHVILNEIIRANPELQQRLYGIFEEYKKGGFKDYASTTLFEFLSELMSDPQISWNMAKLGSENQSLLQKLINWIREVFGAVSMQASEDVVDLILEHTSSKLFNDRKRSGERDYIPGGEELLYKRYNSLQEQRTEDLFKQLRQTVDLKLKAFLNHAKLNPEFDAREVAAAKKLKFGFDRILSNIGNNSSANVVEYLEGFVDFMIEVNEQQVVASNFLNRLSERLGKAIGNNDQTELQLIANAIDNFGKDFFYPNQLMLTRYSEELKKEANQNIYKSLLGQGNSTIDYEGLLENLDFLLNQYNFSNVVGDKTLGMQFADLQIKKAKHFMSTQIGIAEDPTLDDALRNFLLFDRDISWYTRYLGTFSNSALPLKILRNLIVRIDNMTSKEVYNRFPILYKSVAKISKSEMLNMFERDENGNPTGYLVRKVKQGLWSNKIAAFREKWVTDHGLLTLDQVHENPDLYSQFMKDYNAFKAQNVNRRFTNEYYEAFANLKPVTVAALSQINVNIEEISAPFRDKTGTLRKDLMPDNVWNEYRGLLEQKKALASKYYHGTDENPGEAKPVGSVDLEIAEDLAELYKKLGLNLEKDKDNLIKFWEERDRIAAEGGYTVVNGKTEAIIDVWMERNTHVVFEEWFENELKAQNKQDFGPQYEALYEKRRQLLAMYRTADGQPDANRMPEEFKDKIREIDEILSHIRLVNHDKTIKRKRLFDSIESSQFIERGGNKAAVKDVDYFINAEGKPERYSFWTAIKPRNKSVLIEGGNKVKTIYATRRIPNNEWLETSASAGYFNPDYDYTSDEVEQPIMYDRNGRPTEYNNEETYNRIMNDTRLMEAYNAILSIITESNDMLDYTVHKNNYRLPQVMGNMWHYISKKGIISGSRDYMFDHLGITDNDTEFGVKANTMPDGTEILLVPTQYTSMLSDQSVMTTDLVGALMRYYRMAVNYKNKSAIKSDLNLFQDVLKRESRREKRDNEGTLQMSTKGSESLPNLITSVERFIWSNVFGRSRSNKEVTIGDHKFSLDKLAQAVMSYGRDLRLGWNIRSAVSGSVSAFAYYLNEMVSGAGINRSNFIVGLQKTVKDILSGSSLASVGGAIAKNKTVALMEYNGLTFHAMDNSQNTKRMRVGRVALKLLSPYAVWEVASYVPNSVYINAVYNNYRLVTNKDGSKQFMSEADYLKYGYHPVLETGDVTDPVFQRAAEAVMREHFNNVAITLDMAYDLKEGQVLKNQQYGQYVTSNVEDEVNAKLSFVSTHAEGMASQVDRNGVYYHAGISSILMFRAFMPKNIENTMSKIHWNYEKKELAIGTLNAMFYHNLMSGGNTNILRVLPISLGRKLLGINDEKVNAYREKTTDKFNITDKELDAAIQKYSRKFNSQVYTLMLWRLLSIFLINLFSGTDPDDDSHYWTSMLRLFAYKTGLETSSRYNPLDVLGMINSLTPLIDSVQDATGIRFIFEALSDTVGITEKDQIIKRGAYKGLSHAQRAFVKSVPWLNAYYNMKNPAEKLDGMINAIN